MQTSINEKRWAIILVLILLMAGIVIGLAMRYLMTTPDASTLAHGENGPRPWRGEAEESFLERLGEPKTYAERTADRMGTGVALVMICGDADVDAVEVRQAVLDNSWGNDDRVGRFFDRAVEMRMSIGLRGTTCESAWVHHLREEAEAYADGTHP